MSYHGKKTVSMCYHKKRWIAYVIMEEKDK